MSHFAFFEVLKQTKEGSAAWELVISGYLIIQCFDDWCATGPVQLASDVGIKRITEKVKTLRRTHRLYADVFQKSLQALTDTTHSSILAVATPLLTYASLLEADGRLAIAGDVYGTVATALDTEPHAVPSDDPTLGFARRKEAFMLRSVGNFDEAESTYLRSIIAADRVGDSFNVYYSKMGLTNIDRVKGNLKAALNGLTALLTEWKNGLHPQVEDALSDMLNARAAIKHDTGDHDGAILDLLEAYSSSNNEDRRHQILGDLGACATARGYYTFAQNVLHLVVSRCKIAQIQQAAIINLLYLATCQRDKSAFIHFRQQWQPEKCDTPLNVHARFFVAQGIEQFEAIDQALIAYREAVAFASRARIPSVELDALQHLRRLQIKRKNCPTA